MMPPSQVLPVSTDEDVARFATQSGQFRPSDGTAKPDLFMPNVQGETSVMRLRDATESDVWAIGRTVAEGTNRSLYGRADVGVYACAALNLRVVASPQPNHPNHADITGWPEPKPDRKSIAQKLAAASRWIGAPCKS